MENVPENRNLKIREGVYYWRETIKGRKYFESLHVPDTGRKDELKEALTRMREKQKLAREEQFQALENTRTQTGYITIGKLIETYEAAAKAYGLPHKTIKKNINSLKLILSAGNPGPVANMPSTVLNDTTVEKYKASVLASRAQDKASQDTAARTIRATLTQARSIFAKWTFSYYKKLKLPNLDGFKYGAAMRVPVKTYELPPHELIEATAKAGRELRKDQSKRQLYLAFLLTYDLGLRADEAVQCRQNWFRKDDRGIYWLGIIHRADEGYKPKTARSIPVPASVYSDLMEFGGKEEILASHITDRRDLISRTLADWMKGIGWNRNKFAHELRKLRGSFWRSKYGLDRAHSWLGHSNYQTTLNYYAQLPDEPEPYPVDDDLEALRKR